MTYFTYLGGGGDDIGQAITVDSVQGAHVTGTTNSQNDFPIFDPLQDQTSFGGATDAFVAQILTTSSGKALGDYVSLPRLASVRIEEWESRSMSTTPLT